MGSPLRPESIDFHFDLMCPYAYQTSLWIREVRERTGLEINWRFFSLEEINRAEGKKHPWEREWSYGWSLMRIGALLRRQGMDQLDAWYATAGRALHVDGEKAARPRGRHARSSAGLGQDPELVDAAIADPTTGDEVLAEHRRVVAGWRVRGADAVLPRRASACSGRCSSTRRAGEAAEQLWDAVLAWTAFPHLYEIQRPKSPVRREQIAATFQPYLRARDWLSINRGEVVDFAAAAASTETARSGAEGSVA